MTTAPPINRYTENVQRGAAWLDQRAPDWREQINVGVLDLTSKCMCVLGQVFAEKAAALNAYSGYDVVVLRDDDEWAEEHGFTLAYDWGATAEQRNAVWDELQAAWVEELTR